MKTKSGEIIPLGLSLRLKKNKALKKAWDMLRPSCQRDYVERVKNASTPDIKEIKINRVLELTKNYALLHPDKYKKKKTR
jgi:uncharacterized protein YdeI (YjbR/CyaY-like superfamily)